MATDPVMEKFNASIGFDKRMWREDICGSKAYAAALWKASLLTKDEVTSILVGNYVNLYKPQFTYYYLMQILNNFNNGNIVIQSHRCN